jgi:hypothetical protein
MGGGLEVDGGGEHHGNAGGLVAVPAVGWLSVVSDGHGG